VRQKQKNIAIFRSFGHLPPLDWFAMGCFASGWIPHLLDHEQFDGREYDAVVVGGQPTRYKGRNGQIAAYYRHHKIPVIMIEGGWLYEPHVPRHWFTYLNEIPYCPPFECPSDRRLKLNMTVDYRPRGDAILIAGQMPDTDKELNRVTRRLREFTNRKIIYRPRQKDFEVGVDTCDEVSRELTAEEDLDRAWCVITHFSYMGGEALMRGIPVLCHPGASFAEFGQHPMSKINSLKPFPKSAVERWLNRMAYILWSGHEFRTGEGFRWLLENAVSQSQESPR